MRTLSASLTAAMDLRLFTPYIRVHIGSESGGELAYSQQPIKYKLQATEASFTCVPPSDTLANMTTFYFERGAMINGAPDTIKSSFFYITTIMYDGKFIHVEGKLLEPNVNLLVSGNTSYSDVMSNIDGQIDTITYEGAPAWKNYIFLPSNRILNNADYMLSLIRQKYLLFIREEGHTLVGGLQEHFNQISVFCATDTRAEDYTITDELFKFTGGTLPRYFIWRDESATIHTDGNLSHPIHNLGYLESTDDPPAIVNSPLPNSKAIVPIHLKYQRGDYVTINSGAAGDIHEYTGRIDVIEILDIDKEPAWYCEIIPLVHFTNTEGGALPGTIERVAAYTPLVTTDFDGNLDATVNNLQAFADKVDDLALGYTLEEIQDIIGAMLTGNIEIGITVTYDDSDGTIDFVAEVTQAELDAVQAELDLHQTGWITGTGTWTYSSVDDPTGVVTINADLTTVIALGDRIKFTNGGNTIYGILTKISVSSGTTTLTYLHEMSASAAVHLLANSAITNPFYSHVKNPYGFPANPNSWRYSTSNTGNANKNSPTVSTWYGDTGLSATGPSISAPIGLWRPTLIYVMQCVATVVGSYRVTLSTASNSESDTANSWSVTILTTGTNRMQVIDLLPLLNLTAKTTYYLNVLAGNASQTSIAIRGDVVPSQIILECAYL